MADNELQENSKKLADVQQKSPEGVPNPHTPLNYPVPDGEAFKGQYDSVYFDPSTPDLVARVPRKTKATPEQLTKLHIMHEGAPFCKFTRDRPVNWPPFHSQISKDDAHQILGCYRRMASGESMCNECCMAFMNWQDEA